MAAEKLSPAERLAKTKRRERPKRNAPPAKKDVIWQTTLRERREALDLSLRDVAVACGLSVAAYFRVEHGYADPCLTTAVRVATFFGAAIGDLWTGGRGK